VNLKTKLLILSDFFGQSPFEISLLGMPRIPRSIISALIFFVMLFGIASIFFVVGHYAKAFQAEASMEKKDIMEIQDQIVIDFSQTMLPDITKQSVSIVPFEKVNYVWRNSGKQLVITPEKGWKFSTSYNVKIENARNIFYVPSDSSFSFQVEDYPKIQSFYPETGAKDVVADIEDPVKIVFDKPLNEYGVKFKVSPLLDLTYEISDDQRKIKLMAKDGFAKGQKYEFDVYLKHKSEDDYQKIYATYFETKKPVPVIAEWEKDFALRLDQAKKFTVPKIETGKYIDINLKSQVMTIFENGNVLDAYMISSGKRGMDTPQGSFQIRNKARRPWSKAYGLYMPFWMALVGDGKYGIHELPEWPGGYKEGTAHLGTPVSHGCVRLGIGPAERVWNWAEIGTPVIIHI